MSWCKLFTLIANVMHAKYHYIYHITQLLRAFYVYSCLSTTLVLFKCIKFTSEHTWIYMSDFVNMLLQHNISFRSLMLTTRDRSGWMQSGNCWHDHIQCQPSELQFLIWIILLNINDVTVILITNQNFVFVNFFTVKFPR